MCAMALPLCGNTPSLRHRQSLLQSLSKAPHSRSLRCSSSRHITCRARHTDDSSTTDEHTQKQTANRAALPLAALLAASLALGSATFPADALAARSGGRIGGSSGFRSAPRAAPRSSPAPRAAPRQYNNYYNYSAPPLVGGYGYGGFGGFGGINVFPSFGVPVFGLGSGFFNLVLIAVVFSTVTGIVRSVLGGRRRNDDFDEFD